MALGSFPPFPWTPPTDTDGDGIPDESDNHCAGFSAPTTIAELQPSTTKAGRLVGIVGTGYGLNAAALADDVAQTTAFYNENTVGINAPSPDGQYTIHVENPEGCRSFEDPTLTVDASSGGNCGLLGLEGVGLAAWVLQRRRRKEAGTCNRADR